MEDLKAPSNAIKLKYDLQRLVNTKWALTLKNGGCTEEVKACKAFMRLMDIEWREKVTVFARAVLNRRKYELTKELPSPADVESLTKHLVQKLKSVPLKAENYQRIVTLVQTRLLLYNKRRTGELEVIKIRSYASRSQGLDGLDESLAGDLTDIERKLLESQDFMKVRGKRGKPVPVIIPPDCRLPLMFLADRENRSRVGISPKNSYLFPNSVNSYARAYESLKAVCSEVHLTAPNQITSVTMRKYTATLTQMLNLSSHEMQWVYQHLGHTKSVHKEHYRQMSPLLERTQISKLFLIQDLNLTAKFKGKKLEELEIKDIVFANEMDDGGPENCDDPSEISVPSAKLSLRENIVSAEEVAMMNEATQIDEEEEKEEDEEEEEEEQDKPRKKQHTRQRWSKAEVTEIKKDFKEFLKTGTTPNIPEIQKGQKKSENEGGVLHMRTRKLIQKKISNMKSKK